jgi:tetratricopeptide (TPR) repeat protein
MNFLANCDAVIFDLRRNGGGSPGMIRFITSWLFEEPTHLNSLYWREGDRTEEFWTQADIPGKRLAEVPAFVLTSNFTFSGGEEFTYNLQSLKRATIIGETTGGGAHPGGTVPVGERFMAFIPTGRAINPITGTNWEGTGVVPDIQVAADDALDTALPLAREAADKRRQVQLARIEDLWRRFEAALTSAPTLISEGQSAQAEAALRDALTEGLEAGFLGEEDINVLGYEQLNGDRVETAILIFRVNAARFPESANVHDSLGEAYMKAGRNEQAIESYRKALSIDPELTSAREALKTLNAGR